jgi:hypothetical protein
MFRTLVRTGSVAVDQQRYTIHYFELRTHSGVRRFSAEIVLGPGDCIILDDDSVDNLELRAARVVPATLYSRMLSRTA